MRYLRCVQFSSETVRNPNLYPYNILRNKTGELLTLDPITMLYGDNGSGKSTLLNLLAAKLGITGADIPHLNYFEKYLQEMQVSFDCDDNGKTYQRVPENSRYLKSEDILYEIKKIQQESILREGYLYQRRKLGMTREQVLKYQDSRQMQVQMERHLFAQEKYSNGETALQIFEDYLVPDGLYLLDEPEVSLSPEKQLALAEMITHSARFLGTQFIIATHSPLLLGSLQGTIYNFSQENLNPCRWQELPSVKTYAKFFKERYKEL
ncbi:putative ATPase [Enterococcus sp. PF1-24]|uniref:AAA family ATPase n=1 Tax=unclassified Enterococcus TaxID=2608891 RepID=UPI0024766363|nr:MULTISPECIES: AAA family ATPase [unclassified Enterococcus]MDH6364985.1 putative ATPase [Enterococcus sp. PFB1-1]MDH6402086.1 putative ATPase [Enterococcus sp. PF1-24]